MQFSLRWLGGRSRLGSIFRDGLETAEDSSWGQVGASRWAANTSSPDLFELSWRFRRIRDFHSGNSKVSTWVVQEGSPKIYHKNILFDSYMDPRGLFWWCLKFCQDIIYCILLTQYPCPKTSLLSPWMGYTLYTRLDIFILIYKSDGTEPERCGMNWSNEHWDEEKHPGRQKIFCDKSFQTDSTKHSDTCNTWRHANFYYQRCPSLIFVTTITTDGCVKDFSVKLSKKKLLWYYEKCLILQSV